MQQLKYVINTVPARQFAEFPHWEMGTSSVKQTNIYLFVCGKTPQHCKMSNMVSITWSCNDHSVSVGILTSLASCPPLLWCFQQVFLQIRLLYLKLVTNICCWQVPMVPLGDDQLQGSSGADSYCIHIVSVAPYSSWHSSSCPIVSQPHLWQRGTGTLDFSPAL